MFKYRSRQIGLLLAIIPISLTVLTASGCNRDPNVRKHKYLESGIRYEKNARYKEATIQFANALKVDHNFSDAHYELAKTYFKMGSVQAGYGELMKTVELAPNNVAARLDLGGLLLGGNALDRAAEQVKAVLAIDPNNSDAYALMSGISARKGDGAAALTNIRHAITLKPNQASYHTGLALILNSDPANAAEVEQELQKAIALDPKDARAQIVLATILEKKGDKQGAEQHYLAGVQQDPKQLQARSSLAGLYFREGDKAKAEATLRKAVEDLNDNEAASDLLKDYYFRTNQSAVAESVYADLLAKYPKSFPIKMTYGSILAARGEFDKVAPIAEDLNKTNGGNPQVQILKSALLLNNGKIDEAYTLLQNASKSAPTNVQLQLAMGRVAQMKGDLGAAEGSYNMAEKLAPLNVDAQSGLAQLALKRNDSKALIAVADKTIQMHPDFGDAYLWRGMGEADLKQYDKAETDLQAAISKAPDSAVGYTQFGLLRMREGKYPEALAMMEKALEKDPNSVPALGAMVSVYASQKQIEKAVPRIQQQIAKSPKNAAFYTLLAGCQMGLKDLQGAKDNSKKAIELDPADGRAVQIYAQASADLGDKDEAIRAWMKWSDAHPKDATATSMIALLEEQKGDMAKAMEYYKKSLDIDSSQGLAANNLAYIMVKNGQDPDVALTYAQTARRLMPTNPNTADTLALAYYYKGTYYSARDLLEDAQKQSPNNVSVHYHLGMTYNKLGRKADAIAQLKKAVALASGSKSDSDIENSREAQKLLGQIS